MQQKISEVAYNAARSEMLLQEDRGFLEAEGMEKTYKISQQQLKQEVDITTAQKVLDHKGGGVDRRDSHSIYLHLDPMRLIILGTDDIC